VKQMTRWTLVPFRKRILRGAMRIFGKQLEDGVDIPEMKIGGANPNTNIFKLILI